MTWLAWRQLRAPAAATYGAAALLAIALLVTGLRVGDLAHDTPAGFLQALAASSTDTAMLTAGMAAVLLLPAMIGAFWGAPIVARELEAGTHRLVWCQSVTRTRWLATRLGTAAVASAAVAALVGLLLAWWCRPLDAAILRGEVADGPLGLSRIAPLAFPVRGIAPIGYALFALALGAAAGTVVRRVVPAMAITLAIFVAVQVATPTLVRPLLWPVSLTTALTEENLDGIVARFGPAGFASSPVRDVTVAIDRPGAWIVANDSLDASGAAVAELPAWVAYCAPPPPGLSGIRVSQAQVDACFARLAAEGYRQRVDFQPASRYWTLQAIETGAFVVLAALLAAFTFRRLHRLA